MNKQELQRLCDAASPGPWEPNEYGVGEFWVSSAQYDEAGEDVSVAVCLLDSDIRYRVAGMDQQQADMKFIAAARTAIPELLAELAAVTAERDALNAENERLHKDAERYRWLRVRWGRIADTYDGDSDRLVEIREADDRFEGWDVSPESLDAAVDAAMEKENKP